MNTLEEQLAYALTHCEQGHYEKNLEFIKEVLKRYREQIISKLPEKYTVKEGEDTSEAGFNTAVDLITKIIKGSKSLL